MTDNDVISIKGYIDNSIEGLKDYFDQHFDLNDKALKLANESMSLQVKAICEDVKEVDKRVTNLETTRTFTAGKMWMVMAIFAGIPTILALIALFTG